MNAKTQKAYDAAQEAIGEASTKLSRGEYKDFLDELSSHLQCLIDCWNEEEQHQSEQ